MATASTSIFKSLEQGPTYRVSLPKYPSKDPHYRILARQLLRDNQGETACCLT